MNTFFKNKAGEDVFVLGLQTHNSSSQNDEMLDRSIAAVKLFGGNTLETPLYWYQMEPEEGVYDFSSLHHVVERVRSAGLYLVLLWFGFSKNAENTYMPAWVKRDPVRFKWAVGPDGTARTVMSPNDDAVYEADARCFSRFMRELKRIDGKTGTVLTVQVENEIGLGLYETDRCYSKKAQAQFEQGVPSLLDGIVLEDSGTDNCGTSWYDRFGRHAHEAFTAYSLARQVERIARAGKAEYDLPLYMNTMVGEVRQEIAGFSYSSGTPCGRTLDIWHRAAPSIDLFAPDIYQQFTSGYLRTCARHCKPYNALFIPESGLFGQSPAMNALRAVAQYGAIGIAGFGAESVMNDDDSLVDAAKPTAITYRALSMLSRQIIRYRGSDKLFAVVQEEAQAYAHITRGKVHLTVHFTSMPGHKDNKTVRASGSGLRIRMRAPENQKLLDERGRMLVVEENEYEYYLSGVGCQVRFLMRPDFNDPNPNAKYKSRSATELCVYSVEEGHFDGYGHWVCEFTLRGDEINNGVFVRPDVVVRVRLNPRAGEQVDW